MERLKCAGGERRSEREAAASGGRRGGEEDKKSSNRGAVKREGRGTNKERKEGRKR